MNMNYKKIKNIHFVGIKGVGMTPLAIIAKEAGFQVSGCDTGETFITDESLKEKGITPLIGFNRDHINNADLVITTGAHGGYDNKEVTAAKELDIPVWTQGKAVGEFMKGKIFKRILKGISIAGCHGKTTTTAMIATVFKYADKDPSYIIGTGTIPSLGTAGHYGKGEYFIAEADEYANEPTYDKTPKFLLQRPYYLVITNIEFDHPDIYNSIREVRKAYSNLLNNINRDGKLVINGDDKEIKKIIENKKLNCITFGYNSDNNYILKNVSITKGETFFSLYSQNTCVGEFIIKVPGQHNVLNATAAIIVALEAGIALDTVKNGLLYFNGSKRRFEYVGKLHSGAEIYDDYGHHPSEIQATLRTMKLLFPDKNIVCIFQPHTFSRTKKLFKEFLQSFSHADTIIMTDIFSSKREAADPTISSEMLANELKKTGKQVFYLPALQNVVEYLQKQQFNQTYSIITMGAGDVYRIAEFLSLKKEK